MSTPDSYLLKIRGDSMIDAQIADGDYVVIKPSKVAADGDIVVAQVEENEVTLKQLFRESGRVRLQPANKAYKPMYYPAVNVQGCARRRSPPRSLARASAPGADLSTAEGARSPLRGEIEADLWAST